MAEWTWLAIAILLVILFPYIVFVLSLIADYIFYSIKEKFNK